MRPRPSKANECGTEVPGSARCDEAVILVPGLLGSELADGDGLVWGLRPQLLARQLRTGEIAKRLRCRANDGVYATAVLRKPGYLPGLFGIDPYTPMLTALRQDICVHPDAVRGFAYDWRRSIEDAARGLATAAEELSASWRRHPAGRSDARVNLVCHSMGGLVARYFTDVLGGHVITHRVITLGTPFFGSVKSASSAVHGPRSSVRAAITDGAGDGADDAGVLRAGTAIQVCGRQGGTQAAHGAGLCWI